MRFESTTKIKWRGIAELFRDKFYAFPILEQFFCMLHFFCEQILTRRNSKLLFEDFTDIALIIPELSDCFLKRTDLQKMRVDMV